MDKRFTLLGLVGSLLLFTAASQAESVKELNRVLQYDPVVVTLAGKVRAGRFQHPNGKWYPMVLLRLATPVAIAASKTNPEFDTAESNIIEIHIYSSDTKLMKQLAAADSKNVTLQGKLFHGHTAWHRRKLVMTVSRLNLLGGE